MRVERHIIKNNNSDSGQCSHNRDIDSEIRMCLGDTPHCSGLVDGNPFILEKCTGYIEVYNEKLIFDYLISCNDAFALWVYNRSAVVKIHSHADILIHLVCTDTGTGHD